MARRRDRDPARKKRDLRSILGWVVVAPWLAALSAWFVGRIVGDRFLATQYLEWIPTEALVLSGLAVALVEGLLRGRRARRVRIPLLIVLGMTAWLVLGEWRMWRLLTPAGGSADFRLTFMNISHGTEENDLGPLFEAGGEIVILSNVHPQPISFERLYGFHPQELLERATGITPGEAPPSEVHFVRHASFRVLSKWPVRRRASTHAGPQESWLADDVQLHSGILMLELEGPDGPLTVWAVDMPRGLGISRRELFESAAARVDGVERVLVADDQGRWRPSERSPDDPLFTPDIVVGDFNTPGHAWSVSRFVPGLRPARADAGIGPAGTWPAWLPLFEIDLARLGSRVHAVANGRIRCPGVRHLGLWVDLVR
jgi:hypothetical protein